MILSIETKAALTERLLIKEQMEVKRRLHDPIQVGPSSYEVRLDRMIFSLMN